MMRRIFCFILVILLGFGGNEGRAAAAESYDVYQRERLLERFADQLAAITYAKRWDHASVRVDGQWIWDNYPYEVYQQDRFLKAFPTLPGAVEYAKRWEKGKVLRGRDGWEIWQANRRLRGFVLLDAPLIRQNPELPRGCEVTSVAMMLNFSGRRLNKMELAGQVIKDPTPARRRNGKIVSWGDPHRGFVGNMYDLTKPGYGVYHEPLHILVNQYGNGKGLDLTGLSFEEMVGFLERGQPVVTIVNSRFRPVFDWVIWQGPLGPVRATYREHAVLLVGYDQRFVYINDPLSGQKNRKINRESFRQAWEQMGRQAITYMR